jgi:solute carrier family 25 (adenine nucleotide translocator) protein 4/5/6/31
MSTQPRKYTAIMQSLRRVVAEEGVVGLYRGNLANVVRVVPTYGFKFAFNDWFRELVAPGVRAVATTPLPSQAWPLP